MIAGLRKFADDHGRPPLSTELLAAGVGVHGYPAVSVVQREFGSWANGMEAAGFERPLVGRKPNGMRPRLTTEELVLRIRRESRDGVAPSTAGPMFSTYQTLRKRGIEWVEACAMAGVRPRYQRRSA